MPPWSRGHLRDILSSNRKRSRSCRDCIRGGVGAGDRLVGNADSVAAKTGCNARLVREWLDAQAAGGLVAYDPAADTYELSPEAALALADDGSAVFVARAMNAVGSMFLDVQKVAAAFRGNGALAWGEHHPC